MPEIIEKILSLPQEERLQIAMRILLSIQEENGPAWHDQELASFQQKVEEGKVSYHSEPDFWQKIKEKIGDE